MGKAAFVLGLLVLTIGVVGCAATGGSTPPASRAISGQISYAGTALAGHKIVIVVVGSAGKPGYSALISSPGPYTVSDVADGTYTLYAFIDLGDDMGPPQANEPLGWFDAGGDGSPDAVVIQNGNSATAVNVTIRDR